MHALIKDRHGLELARYTLEGDDPLDCDHWARTYAYAMGVTLTQDGHIPDGCEDISITLQEEPGSCICWNSENYFIE